MPNAKPIPVVCAVIESGEGRVLVAQRPAHKHLGLKWEFPGGKVEPGELPERALIREIAEELGCEVTIGRALPAFTHDYGTVVIEMMPFTCALAPGSAAPHAREHVALRWATPAELRTLDLAPADAPVLAWLLQGRVSRPPTTPVSGETAHPGFPTRNSIRSPRRFDGR